MPEPGDCIEPLKTYYLENPDIYELDKTRLEAIMPKRAEDTARYGDFYTLINAWASSWMTHESITTPPEISDYHFPIRRLYGKFSRAIGRRQLPSAIG